ncbi:hypothetical protein ACIRBY_37305 [Streptomyces sp. NPDC096136]|uniref:hypothetical protein n=1 Tax=Streptomyces sp. NPDC096136 TaxID=3366076 RepID=UPI00382DF6C1
MLTLHHKFAALPEREGADPDGRTWHVASQWLDPPWLRREWRYKPLPHGALTEITARSLADLTSVRVMQLHPDSAARGRTLVVRVWEEKTHTGHGARRARTWRFQYGGNPTPPAPPGDTPGSA